MPAVLPSPDRSEGIHLGIFADTVRAVLGRAETPWPRPHPHPYPEPDEVSIPPQRPAPDPVPPPPPPEDRHDLPRIGLARSATDDAAEPALAMLSRGRHSL